MQEFKKRQNPNPAAGNEASLDVEQLQRPNISDTTKAIDTALTGAERLKNKLNQRYIAPRRRPCGC